MTFGYGAGSQPDGWSETVLTTKEAEDCLIPMGFTSENVAQDFGISREVQDKFAAESFQKAAAAQKAGKFKAEIVPIKVKIVDPKTEKEHEIIVDADDGIRDGVTPQSLAKLKPAFAKTGSTHAGIAYMLQPSRTVLSQQYRKRLASLRRCRCCRPDPAVHCSTSRSSHRR